MIRCILFDLAETLWTNRQSTIWEHERQCRNQMAAQLLRVYLPAEIYPGVDYDGLSIQLRSAISQRYRYWRSQYYDCEPDPYLVAEEAYQQLRLPAFLAREQTDTLLEAFRDPIPATRQLFDDTLMTLQELQTRGLLLGCVTDRQYGGRSFLTDLQELGLLEYFSPDAIGISADDGKRKPHPAPFLKAMSALKVDPKETAMVGDFLSRDVAGARRLNMLAIWKPKTSLLRELHLSERIAISSIERESLITTAWQQEEALYPEVPFCEIKPFMRPDLIITHLKDLLTIFI